MTAGCSGGSGGGGTLPPPGPPPPRPTSTPTVAPVSHVVSGSVVAISSTAFGPTATGPGLPAATVVIGPTLLQGATAPASLPVGDVAATTTFTGAFTATIPSAPAAPPAGTFVIPNSNVFGFVPPPTGYFVMVFPKGGDGLSAGAPLPVHAFVPVGAGGALGTFRVTTASTDEAAWLAQANLDRASKGLKPEIFDEAAEEVARQHATYLVTAYDDCHYDAQNRGPATRWVQIGGIGQDDEAIASYGGPPTTTTAWWEGVEQAFVSEGPGGYHYQDLFAAIDIWMGLGVTNAPWNGFPSEQYYGADLENINVLNNYALSADTVSCPAGIIANGS